MAFLLDSSFNKETFHHFFKVLTWKEYVQLHQNVPTCVHSGLKKNVLGFLRGIFYKLIKVNAYLQINVIDIYFVLNLR